MKEELYVIWSNEHRLWWKSERRGYTESVNEAGRYSRQEAINICIQANAVWYNGSNPLELSIPETMASEIVEGVVYNGKL